MLRSRSSWPDIHGRVPQNDRVLAGMLASDMWAMQANAIWAAYWFLVFLLQRPSDYKRVVAEVLSSFIAKIECIASGKCYNPLALFGIVIICSPSQYSISTYLLIGTIVLGVRDNASNDSIILTLDH